MENFENKDCVLTEDKAIYMLRRYYRVFSRLISRDDHMATLCLHDFCKRSYFFWYLDKRAIAHDMLRYPVISGKEKEYLLKKLSFGFSCYIPLPPVKTDDKEIIQSFISGLEKFDFNIPEEWVIGKQQKKVKKLEKLVEMIEACVAKILFIALNKNYFSHTDKSHIDFLNEFFSFVPKLNSINCYTILSCLNETDSVLPDFFGRYDTSDILNIKSSLHLIEIDECNKLKSDLKILMNFLRKYEIIQ
jgi:hypothetical protein